MLAPRSRREFLTDVGRRAAGRGMGAGVLADLGLASPAFAAAAGGEEPAPLAFGGLVEPLVGLMQETPVDRSSCRPWSRSSQAGTDLKQLVAAAALANARTFGGEDYVGFHTLMALAPAYHMARELPEDRRALPVLKVLYRNTNRIQEHGGRSREVLHPVEPARAARGRHGRRGPPRRRAQQGHERGRAHLRRASPRGSPDEAFNDLLVAVEDDTEVHRVVLPYRAWDLLDLIGKEQAHTLLRQSVRYCVKSERDWTHTAENDEPRTLLPAAARPAPAARPDARHAATADDALGRAMCQTIFERHARAGRRRRRRGAGRGDRPERVGEAISLAANQLVLRDAGRRQREASPASRPAASTATRSASTPATRPTPGGTWPASPTREHASPA